MTDPKDLYSLVREARLKGLDGITNAEAKKLLPKRVILPLEVQKAELEKFYQVHKRFFDMEEKAKERDELRALGKTTNSKQSRAHQWAHLLG